AHNVMLGVVIQNLIEITLLAEKSGVKRADFLKFFNDSVMGSPFTKYKSPALVNLDFKATFTNVLLLKDLDLGLEAAHELGVVMPVTSATRQVVASEVGDGNVEADFSSLILTWAKHSGMTIASEDTPFDDGLDPEE
ncbi:MAG: NAD(P)-dependent oxidoreductase, partial [Microbacteriaceae bacterium]|nr:NAD(P)-dependent oxidoreductase [Microbacteriaceae bacterium]